MDPYEQYLQRCCTLINCPLCIERETMFMDTTNQPSSYNQQVAHVIQPDERGDQHNNTERIRPTEPVAEYPSQVRHPPDAYNLYYQYEPSDSHGQYPPIGHEIRYGYQQPTQYPVYHPQPQVIPAEQYYQNSPYTRYRGIYGVETGAYECFGGVSLIPQPPQPTNFYHQEDVNQIPTPYAMINPGNIYYYQLAAQAQIIVNRYPQLFSNPNVDGFTMAIISQHIQMSTVGANFYSQSTTSVPAQANEVIDHPQPEMPVPIQPRHRRILRIINPETGEPVIKEDDLLSPLESSTSEECTQILEGIQRVVGGYRDRAAEIDELFLSLRFIELLEWKDEVCGSEDEDDDLAQVLEDPDLSELLFTTYRELVKEINSIITELNNLETMFLELYHPSFMGSRVSAQLSTPLGGSEEIHGIKQLENFTIRSVRAEIDFLQDTVLHQGLRTQVLNFLVSRQRPPASDDGANDDGLGIEPLEFPSMSPRPSGELAFDVIDDYCECIVIELRDLKMKMTRIQISHGQRPLFLK